MSTITSSLSDIQEIISRASNSQYYSGIEKEFVALSRWSKIKDIFSSSFINCMKRSLKSVEIEISQDSTSLGAFNQSIKRWKNSDSYKKMDKSPKLNKLMERILLLIENKLLLEEVKNLREIAKERDAREKELLKSASKCLEINTEIEIARQATQKVYQIAYEELKNKYNVVTPGVLQVKAVNS